MKATNVNNITNYLLFKSGILNLKNLEYDPANAILLNIYIVYAALNTIEELANAPNKGNLSNVPYRLAPGSRHSRRRRGPA